MWGYGPEWGMMGGGWGYGYGGFHFVFWILVVVAIVTCMTWMMRSMGGQRMVPRSRGLDMLEERYARGEIERDEYLQKKKDIAD